MGIFKTTRIRLIKEVKLDRKGSSTSYHTEVNGVFISNSYEYTAEKAEAFFNRVVELKGKTEQESIVKEIKL